MFGLIRGQFGLEGLISSAFFFFNFFVFLLRDVGSAKRQQSSSVPIRDSSKVR